MGFDGSAFDLANEWLFDTPDNGSVEATYTSSVTGQSCPVTLLDIHVSELQFMGDVDVRSQAQYKLLRKSEIPTRPVYGDTLLFGGVTYRIKSAESSELDLNWQIDLETGGP